MSWNKTISKWKKQRMRIITATDGDLLSPCLSLGEKPRLGEWAKASQRSLRPASKDFRKDIPRAHHNERRNGCVNAVGKIKSTQDSSWEFIIWKKGRLIHCQRNSRSFFFMKWTKDSKWLDTSKKDVANNPNDQLLNKKQALLYLISSAWARERGGSKDDWTKYDGAYCITFISPPYARTKPSQHWWKDA